MTFKLQAASKKRTKLRMAISGVPGGGKTYTAIKVAKHLLNEPYKLSDPDQSRIALIDTERSSSEFYADEFSFRHGNLPPERWHPASFREALSVCESECDVVILDSITHEWKWCLNQVEILKPKYKNNTWSTWSEIRPPHDAFVDAIMSSAAHVICTMRSKMATEMGSENGYKKVIQLGLESIQEAELDYAFHVVIDMDRDKHSATVRKTRIRVAGESPLDGKVFPYPGEAFAKILLDCLNSGAVVDVPKPAALMSQTNGNGVSHTSLEGQLADSTNVFDEYSKALADLDPASPEFEAKYKELADGMRQLPVGPARKTLGEAAKRKIEAHKAFVNSETVAS